MKLIWTKSTLPYSVLIRFLTGEDCSHFAFVFESAAKGIMFETNLLGSHPKFFANAKKSFEIVHEMDLDVAVEKEDQLWDVVVEKYDDKPYDYLGVIYLGFWKLMKRFFKVQMPLKNKWSPNGSFFCDEIYAALEEVGFQNVGISSGMDSPLDLWKKLKGIK